MTTNCSQLIIPHVDNEKTFFGIANFKGNDVVKEDVKLDSIHTFCKIAIEHLRFVYINIYVRHTRQQSFSHSNVLNLPCNSCNRSIISSNEGASA